MKKLSILLFAAGVFCVAQVSAQPYAGATIGLADAGSQGDSSTMTRIHAGYRLMEFLALEVAVTEFGTIEIGSPSITSEPDGVEYGIVAFYPFAEIHEVYVRAGQIDWESENKDSALIPSERTTTVKGEDTFYGIGYAVQMSEFGAVRLEASRYEIDFLESGNGDLDTVSFAIEARF